MPPERLFLELTRGIEAMDANEGSGPTNGEAFEAVFIPFFWGLSPIYSNASLSAAEASSPTSEASSSCGAERMVFTLP